MGFPYQFYVDEINKKYESYNRELVLAYTEWHRQIDEWCGKALVGLEQIILCKYPRYYKQPTQAQIDQFHDLLREQAKVWVRLQKRQTRPSSRMPLPKMGRPHQTMEIVLRTTALLSQGQMGSLHGLKKRKGLNLHQMPLR